MFEIVNLSETDMLARVSSDPVNSTHMFSTSDLRKAQSAMMTSLPVTPGGKMPVNVTFAIGGTCQNMFEVARILAASERTMAVPRQPMPPYIVEWLSLATILCEWPTKKLLFPFFFSLRECK